MNQPQDVLGRDLYVGARVGCAFSYSQASVGYIRVGHIVELEENYIKCKWDDRSKISPKMKYGSSTRWILL